jgi:hypothetical protein
MTARYAHGAYLLWLIRNGACKAGGGNPAEGTTVEELLGYFGMATPGSLPPMDTRALILDNALQQLRAVGLLEVPAPGVFKVAPPAHGLLHALGVRLSDLASLRPPRGCVLHPIFGPPHPPDQPGGVFVVMPFTPEATAVYQDHIRPTVEELGLACTRGDEQLSTESVMHDIWRGITAARVVVADCTGRNPNVFYEIGIAHTVGKRVVLLAQDPAEVPFDVRHIRFIKYEPTQEGLEAFRRTLAKTVQDACR